MGGIAHRNAHEEAIQLRLGQRIGTRRFHRVLGGEHHEGRRRRIGLPVDGHLVFLHDFEQGGLGFGACPVDFVRQHDLVHNAAEVQLLLAGFHIEHGKAGNIRRKHVRGKLNTLKGTAERGSQRSGQRCLAEPGHVFDQHVAGANERDEQMVDDRILAHDNLFDIVADVVQCLQMIHDIPLLPF